MRGRVMAWAAVIMWPAVALAQVPADNRMVTERAPEVCFGRVYDAAHLARNPSQSLAELYIARLGRDDPELEVQPDASDPLMTMVSDPASPEGPQSSVMVMARLRDPPARYTGYVTCTGTPETGLRCSAECDGGGFATSPDGDGVMVRFAPQGVRVGVCGEPGNSLMLGARPADRVARVARMPMSSCYAARDASRPGWVRHGPPLRESLARAGTACFTRQYDTGHLARNPEQRVAGLSARATWKPETSDHGASITIQIVARLRDGTIRRGGGQCTADGYAYVCEQPGLAGTVILTRGPNGGVMLRSLPTEDDGRAGDLVGLGPFLGQTLGRGDDVFRLDRSASLTACPD